MSLSATVVETANDAMPQGATVLRDGRGVLFRVWAPQAARVELILESKDRRIPLSREPEGYYSALVQEARAGETYRYILDGGEPLSDPASRFQPQGVLGPSQIVDVEAFSWSDAVWRGVSMPGQVLYEMHIGTFTQEGIYGAAQAFLPELKKLGITVIELMPVGDFAGSFGWGYDGVFPYAPYEHYGRPEDLAAFIDAAHGYGIGVILDVVYNHLGPTGNVFPSYSQDYLSESQTTDWGPAINFDGKNNAPVREYFRENAVSWIRDYHFDGLRVDATQDVHDRSQKHILAEIAEAARRAAGDRRIILIGENEPQEAFYVESRTTGGYGFDALWNDDFHHSSLVALTGQSDAYYSDYKGRPQEFISALKYGYLYQGQWYLWQKKRRGTPSLDVRKSALIHFIQNHDQIANSARASRIHDLATPGKLRAVTAILLLGPETPMLFQGQEYASPTPFYYFADHCDQELAKSVREGRRGFLKQWQSMKDPALDAFLTDPCDVSTFRRCKLDYRQREDRSPWFHLHRDLLCIRRDDPTISAQGRWGLDGSVLGHDAFVIRFFSPEHRDDRLLVVNLGVEQPLSPLPEPLLAPPQDREWQVLWASEHPRYGGNGVAPVVRDGKWRLPGNAAVLLAPGQAAGTKGRKEQTEER